MDTFNTPVGGGLRWLLRVEAPAMLLGSLPAHSQLGGVWAQLALWFALLGDGLKRNAGFAYTFLGALTWKVF